MIMDKALLQQKDISYVWHPCSQMKDYETFSPIIIEHGTGPYLYDIEGNSYLDAVSSWWVNLFGHSNKRLNNAINHQVDKLEHVIFANFTHKPAIELSERIIQLAPEGLGKVFFSDNGSSAVEVALKISFQCHQQSGKSEKKKFAAISGSYHGETLGALSVGSLDLYSSVFNPLLLDTLRVDGPDCYRCSYGLNRKSCSAECFCKMDEALSQEHEKLCAVIIEPMVQCAAGMNMYPPAYLKKLRESCTRYGIHLIADEIAVGFGRTGMMFACEHAGISPDIMCLSKGLTAGYMPLALTLVTDEIYDAFYSDYTELKAFMHSHSYTGNPISCAVACESLNIFRDENIIENNMSKSSYINERISSRAAEHPYIGEYRQTGMIGALELVEDKASKMPFDWSKRVGYEIYKLALKRGVLLRPLGNVIYFMPPYIVSERDIDLMTEVAFESINEFFSL